MIDFKEKLSLKKKILSGREKRFKPKIISLSLLKLIKF